MRNNQPITNREKMIPPGATLVSKTDTKGLITYASKDFSAISEYETSYMVGEPHNLVRDPEMPAAAFADLWQRIREGHPWRGLVKNRAKSGDHYWVEAQVSPQYRAGKLVGYISVRRPPTREQIEAADRAYKEFNLIGKDANLVRMGFFSSTFGALQIKTRLFFLFFLGLVAACFPIVGLFTGVSVTLLVSVSAVLCVAIVPFGIWTIISVLRPLKFAGEILKNMSEGDFTQSLDIRDATETGKVLEGLQMMNTNLSGLIFQMTENGIDLNSGSKTLAESSQNLSTAIEEISQQSSSISSASNQVAQNLQVVSSAVEEMSISIGEVATRATETARVAKEAAVITAETQTLVHDLGAGAANIGRVIEIIGKIAEQTNMLALNASIEAAGAGEAGKGFAVVASEVKELARQTAASSGDIKKQIMAMQKSTEETINAIGSITEIINVVNEGNASIASAVEEQSMTTKEIATNVNQISDASSDINKNISGISIAVTESAKDAHKLSGLSSDLKKMSDALSATVGEFRVQK